MTAGIDGNTRQASKRSLTGPTASTICTPMRHHQALARTFGSACMVMNTRHMQKRMQHLLCKLLDEDQAANEDVGVCHVLLELLVVRTVPQLL